MPTWLLVFAAHASVILNQTFTVCVIPGGAVSALAP